MSNLRVLLVEDSPSDAKLIVRELERITSEVAWHRVDTAEAMRTALSGEPWDLIVSDWSLPSFSARDALALREEAQLDVPFIIVSGTVDEEIAVAAMRAGAQDFVPKDRLARLNPAVERELREHQTRAQGRRAEQALRLSEARFARLAESGIIGIASADLEGRLLDANDAYLDMLGYARADLEAGRLRWDELTPAEWRGHNLAASQDLLSSGVATPWETAIKRRDGALVPVLVGVAMLGDDACIAFIANLTERKRVERALRRSQEQLAISQKLEALGSLAGGVAHDFNNLLTVILSYAGLAIDDLPEGDPLRADLKEIELAGERAAELTRQLLAFGRRQVLEPKVVDLNEVLSGMEKMLRRVIDENVRLILDPAAGLALVEVDPGQMEQVVMNIVVNARDAMPNGGRLVIQTDMVVIDEREADEHPGTAAGPHVAITISDDGTGMDDQTRARIFEPFFSTKGAGKGTGLGLSTVLGIVQQSGGAIWVESEPGLGTTFKVLLKPVDASAAESRRWEGESSGNPRGAETILLVEDDPGVRSLIRAVLVRLGYQVLEAESAGDALLISEQHAARIDLLLTDVVMPRMGGRQLAERLSPLRPDMRVLYMSGYTDDAVVRHGVQHPEVAFLQKPVRARILAQRVREILDGRPRRR